MEPAGWVIIGFGGIFFVAEVDGVARATQSSIGSVIAAYCGGPFFSSFSPEGDLHLRRSNRFAIRDTDVV